MCLLVMCSSLSPNYAVSSRMHFSALDSTQSYSLKSRGVPLKRSTLHLPFSGYRFYSHFLCPAFPQCDVSLELVPWWIAGFLLHLPLQHSKHALGSLLFWSLQPRNVLISRTSLLSRRWQFLQAELQKWCHAGAILGSKTRLPRFESWLYHLLDVCFGANDFISVVGCFFFLICQKQCFS